MSIDSRIPVPQLNHAWVQVDLGAIVRNAIALRARGGRPLLPMIKADAYGLGAVRVAGALESVSPWGYGVAVLAEADQLRDAGISRPIVVFTPLRAVDRDDYATRRLRPVICNAEALKAWIPTGLPFHLEIDTGMSRTGFRWDEVADIAPLLVGVPKGQWEGIFTHLHSPEEHPETIDLQRTRLEGVLEGLGERPELVHVANSIEILGGDLPSGETLVRPGIYLYGGRAGTLCGEIVAKLCAPIVAERRLSAGDTVGYGAEWVAKRETWIGTVAVGYADGVPRSLGNRGRMEVGGRVVPIVGRVAMDFIMVDLGDRPDGIGTIATVWGGLVSLDEQAESAGTIGYELLTMIGGRVPRHYLEFT